MLKALFICCLAVAWHRLHRCHFDLVVHLIFFNLMHTPHLLHMQNGSGVGQSLRAVLFLPTSLECIDVGDIQMAQNSSKNISASGKDDFFFKNCGKTVLMTYIL